MLALPLLFALALAVAGAATTDVVTLLNGDRISGRIVSKGRKFLRFQTPHGVLSIGLDKIDRLQRADGTEEVLNRPATATAPVPTPTPRPREPVRLALLVSGKTFWQAWGVDAAPSDPTLRLELRLDDRAVATWVDTVVDEGEIKGALVNSFSFTPDSLKVAASAGVKALPPEIRVGRISLGLELPQEMEGSRKMRLAYQGNAGTPAVPEWRDLVLLEVPLTLTRSEPNAFLVEQDRGRMEYSKRRMKNVDTFALGLKVDVP